MFSIRSVIRKRSWSRPRVGDLKVALGQISLSVLQFSLRHYHPTCAAHSSLSTCCFYQKNKGSKPGSVPKSSAFSEVGEHWILGAHVPSSTACTSCGSYNVNIKMSRGEGYTLQCFVTTKLLFHPLHSYTLLSSSAYVDQKDERTRIDNFLSRNIFNDPPLQIMSHLFPPFFLFRLTYKRYEG